MKNFYQFLFYCMLFLLGSNSMAQGVISSVVNKNKPSSTHPTCGEFELMKKINRQSEDYLKLSDQFMKQLGHVVNSQKRNKSSNEVYEIPIVFHVVYNNNAENIPDSVIFDQVKVLNDAFRRQHADTANTRAEFKDLVGDAKIEFKLANMDPQGVPSNGITRTNTSITNFGGILPYGPGQNQQISNWVADSLYYNYFRIADSTLGGISPWNTNLYLNVWIGDLRILEPRFNNFEELVFFALATPPADHANWPEDVLDEINAFEQGVLLHYVNVGSNNPNSLPAPYGAFNGVVTTGEILVHEVGHYLGLRHIWGDGDCSMDDFIDDTPNSLAASSWDCNYSSNTCVDTIQNSDLRNMVENYMDYSSGNCQNSFTMGQIDLMRSVLRNNRALLLDTVSSVNNIEQAIRNQIKYYPNPTTGNLNVDLGQQVEQVDVRIQNYLGQVVFSDRRKNTAKFKIDLNVTPGIYFLSLSFGNQQHLSFKVIKE